MKVGEAIKAVLAGEDLTDEARDALEGFDPDAGVSEMRKKLTAAQKVAERFEAQRDEAQEQMRGLSERVEELEGAGSSESEKLAKQIEKAEAKVAELTQTLQQEQASHSETKRGHALARIGGQLQFVSGLSQAAKDSLIASAFTGADLDDADEVTASLERFKRDNAGILLAEGANGGTGAKPTNGAAKEKSGSAYSGPKNIQEFMALSPTEKQEQLAGFNEYINAQYEDK